MKWNSHSRGVSGQGRSPSKTDLLDYSSQDDLRTLVTKNKQTTTTKNNNKNAGDGSAMCSVREATPSQELQSAGHLQGTGEGASPQKTHHHHHHHHKKQNNNNNKQYNTQQHNKQQNMVQKCRGGAGGPWPQLRLHRVTSQG